MTQEAIAAVSWSSSTDSMERYRAASQQAQSVQLETMSNGAHLSVPPPDGVAATSGMNVRNVFGAIQTGLRDGFVQPDMDRMLAKLREIERPDSLVTPGELQMDMLRVSGSMAVGDIYVKMTNKITEGLQTLVIKQA
jgi:hypothetical protein